MNENKLGLPFLRDMARHAKYLLEAHASDPTNSGGRVSRAAADFHRFLQIDGGAALFDPHADRIGELQRTLYDVALNMERPLGSVADVICEQGAAVIGEVEAQLTEPSDAAAEARSALRLLRS